MKLKNGQTTTDPRLDRIPEFDPRSRSFPILTELEPAQIKKPRSYTWKPGAVLDQGREGACVGFAFAHELGARPQVVPEVNGDSARNIYKRAQKIDEWPGENYAGTSVLAGAKIVREQGFYSAYRWAFGLEEMILAVGYTGPVILGVDWFEGMFEPQADGYILPAGRLSGGHAILCNAVSLKNKRFTLTNSWGPDWGNDGQAFISFASMEYLLSRRGEVCCPTRVPLPRKTA